MTLIVSSMEVTAAMRASMGMAVATLSTITTCASMMEAIAVCPKLLAMDCATMSTTITFVALMVATAVFQASRPTCLMEQASAAKSKDPLLNVSVRAIFRKPQV